ncbi:tRNA pseudouridine(65) synthase TruC, partial [Salmonella enterica subsp. enterica serovar Enteritidis]|nr:tRNA pseudouridine(65) synthase TruC [Salmonella enterica subsp. enterica serovar Enteritidis]
AFNRLTDNQRVDITAPVDTDWLMMCAQFGFQLP